MANRPLPETFSFLESVMKFSALHSTNILYSFFKVSWVEGMLFQNLVLHMCGSTSLPKTLPTQAGKGTRFFLPSFPHKKLAHTL